MSYINSANHIYSNGYNSTLREAGPTRGGQSHHIDQLVRARVLDTQTFTLLITPQSITAIGLRFMTFKVMARRPVADWKTEWSVATILEALKECYPLDASDSFVSIYDKWLLLSKSMRKTIKVDQNNIALLRKQFSETLIAASDEYGDMPEEYEEELLGRFMNTFTTPPKISAQTESSTTISRRTPSRTQTSSLLR